MEYIRRAWMLWVPLVLVIVAAVIAFAMGYKDAAWAIGNLGTAVVLFLLIFVLAFFDPMDKWPNRGFRDRLALLMTFGKADPPPATVHSLDESRRGTE